jgi:hypothetical protein
VESAATVRVLYSLRSKICSAMRFQSTADTNADESSRTALRARLDVLQEEWQAVLQIINELRPGIVAWDDGLLSLNMEAFKNEVKFIRQKTWQLRVVQLNATGKLSPDEEELFTRTLELASLRRRCEVLDQHLRRLCQTWITARDDNTFTASPPDLPDQINFLRCALWTLDKSDPAFFDAEHGGGAVVETDIRANRETDIQ